MNLAILRRTCVLPLLTLAAVAHAAAPETVTIAYKPSAAAVEYWVRSIVADARHKLGAAPKWHEARGLALVHQATQQAPDGKLAVAVSSNTRSLAVDKKVIDVPGDQKKEVFAYRMTARGEPADPAQPKEETAHFTPIFPAEAIPVGHTWKVTIPPSETFRLPIEVTHVFETLKDSKGARCAVIKTTGKARGLDAKVGCLVNLEVNGRGAFDLAAGNWVKRRMATSLFVTFQKPLGDGADSVARNVLRIAERREPGAGDGPSKSDD